MISLKKIYSDLYKLHAKYEAIPAEERSDDFLSNFVLEAAGCLGDNHCLSFVGDVLGIMQKQLEKGWQVES